MHAIEYWAFSGVGRILRLLPLSLVRFVARATADILFTLVPVRKKLTLDNLHASFPDFSEQRVRGIAREAHRNLVTAIFELMWTPRMTRERFSREVRIVNPEAIEEALKRGRGLVLMSGHFGNWEWLSIGSALALGKKYTVIVHPPHNPRVAALIDRWRTSMGNRTVPMGVAVRDVVRTLRERGIVAILADQSGPGGGLFVDFFGRPAATYEGPAIFALKYGAPVLMGLGVRRDDGAYDVRLEPIPSDDLSGATDENIRIFTERHVKVLEQGIRAHPGHWLWQHRRWKHSPPEAATLSPAAERGEERHPR